MERNAMKSQTFTHVVQVEIAAELPLSTSITSKTLLATLHPNHQSIETNISGSNHLSHHRSIKYQIITPNNYVVKDQTIIIKTNMQSHKLK